MRGNLLHNLRQRLFGIAQRGRDASASRTGAGVWPRTLNLWLGAAALLCLTLPSPLRAAVQGDQITNSAWFESIEKVSPAVSNTVAVVVRTPSLIEFLNYAPGYSGAVNVPVSGTEYRIGNGSAPFTALPAPLPPGGTTPLDLTAPLPLTSTGYYHEGDPIFIRVTDRDQNLDRTVAETILISITDTKTGDVEILRLVETGLDTGVFTGYIQSSGNPATSFDGTLQTAEGGRLFVTYTDVVDGSDTSTSAALVDPLGLVFDSRTGQPVNGATVTLWDVANDRAATVLGDDGFSSFPDTLISGGSTSDAAGRIYSFSPGHFRFPFVYPGTYQLRVTPPAGYTAPSTVATATLQGLPGAPYAIELGSRGEVFAINPGPALRIDIPLDPPTTGMWLQKSAGKPTAAIGDFVPFELSLQNFNTVVPALGVVIDDYLPRGLRYVKGSTTVDGLPAADPTVSADGRTLNFSLATVAPAATVRLRYVVEVSAGARPGEAINIAAARDGSGPLSNSARARIEVKDDFLRSRSMILGNVYQGACGAYPGATAAGLEGVRIYLEDGTFAVTDKAGRYHFEGVQPGLHVVQIDPETIPPGYEITPCEESNRFAGAGNSQFVDLDGGTLWRADFQVGKFELLDDPAPFPVIPEVLPEPTVTSGATPTVTVPVAGGVTLRLTSTTDGERTMTFTVAIANRTVALQNSQLTVTLPVGVFYLPGSTTIGETAAADPIVNERELTYDLKEIAVDGKITVTLQGQVNPQMIEDQPRATAVLHFNTEHHAAQATPEAENSYRLEPNIFSKAHQFVFYPHFESGKDVVVDEDRRTLDRMAAEIKGWEIKRIVVIGHTDNVRLSIRTKKLFGDNMGLSRARASAVADYLGSQVDLSAAELLKVGMGPTLPVASNATEAGKARNRRVEIQIETLRAERVYKILPVLQDSGEKGTETEGLAVIAAPVEAPAALAAPTVSEAAQPEVKEAQSAVVAPVEKSVGILSPAADAILISPINVVRVRLDSKLRPLLTVDGEEIPAKRIGFTMADPESKKTLYSYIGVNFGKAGQHEVVIKGLDPFGNARFEEKFSVKRSGEIRSIRQIEEGQNVADGKTPIKVRIELRDEFDTIIKTPLEIDFASDTLRMIVSDNHLEEPRRGQSVKMDADGWLSFAPTSTTGQQRATLRFNDLNVEVKTYVKPHLRDWILVGLAEGTLGYNTISGHLDPLQDNEIEDQFYDDGRLAFFAKGKVKGEWLLTAAYDSGKEREDRLHGLIRPETYYSIYGDASQPFSDAPSTRKLYVKLEREQFYALFGDYDTGLTVTELSRYTRSLTGLKTEYVGDKFAFKAFAADTSQAYARDEIPGDGTSGLYRLRAGDIVLNSDKVTIEVRDRFHSEIVLSSKTLARYLDYDLDYNAGTLFFKEAIPSRDENLNPVIIVVEYESLQRRQSAIDFGGRASVKPFGEVAEVGASYVREGATRNEGQLTGIDTKVKLGETTTITAEAAASSKATNGVEKSGSAWLAQVEHRTNKLDSRVYVRQNGEGFGLGQQAGSEQATRKIGGSGRYNLSEAMVVGGELSRDSNLTSGSERDLAQADLQISKERYTLGGGLRQAIDRIAGSGSSSSTQLFVNGSTQLTSRLKARIAHDQSLGSQGGAADYPTRTLLGADFQLSERVALFGEQEFTFGDNQNTNMTRLGLKATPWNGGQVTSTVEQQSTEYGPRVFSVVGLKQIWQIDQNWSADAGLDRSDTLRHPGNPSVSGAPSASGGKEDFTAISLGANRKSTKWTWSNRIEKRFGTLEEKFGLFTGAEGDLRDGVAIMGKAQIFDSRRSGGQHQLSGDLRGGLAWRPVKTRWTVLERLDYLFDRQSGTSFDYSNWRLVNNLNANFRPDWLTQIAIQYGAKYVSDTIDGRSYAGYTDLIGLEARHDFAKKWDVGLQGQVLHSWQAGQSDYRLAPSVGYRVMKNVWLSGGYNLVGFQDQDFSAADFTAQGPFIKFRVKFDQNSVREALSQF